MKEKVRFLGMDVHAETIAVAIAEAPRVRGRANHRRGRKREIVPRECAPAGTFCAFRPSAKCPLRRGKFLAM